MIFCHVMNEFYVKSCIVFMNTLPYCTVTAAATYKGVWDETLMIFLKNLAVYKNVPYTRCLASAIVRTGDLAGIDAAS